MLDNVVTITRRTALGVRTIVRVYSGVDGRMIRSTDTLTPPNSDLNNDGVTDAADLGLLLESLGDAADAPADYDLNADGALTMLDANVILKNFGATDPSDQVAAVPCPNGGITCPPPGVARCPPCGDEPDSGGPGGGPDGVGDLGGGDPGAGGGVDEGDGSDGGHDVGGGCANCDPPPPGGCTVSIEPLDGMPDLHSVGVWSPDDTDDDTTNDTDDLPTIKATAAGAGTYAWTVTQGAAKVRLFNADTNTQDNAPTSTTIRIQGVTASADLDDVEIKVTFTPDNGDPPCMDTLKLTVIAVALSFRPTNPNAQPPEVWSDDNDITQSIQFGEPQLGPIMPNVPPGATWFRKNIEIAATLQPCIVGENSTLSFKQRRNGFAWLLIGNDVVDSGSCTTWCDDSPLASAQDLDIDTQQDCTLFMVDGPGIGAGNVNATCPPEFEGNRVINCMQFRSWLEVDGFRGTANKPWHASTEMWCHNGTAVLSSMFVQNLVGDGPFDCPPPPAQAQDEVSTQRDNEVHVAEVIMRIKSQSHLNRLRAQESVIKAIREKRLTAEARKSLIAALIPIGRIKKDKYDWDGPTGIAIKLFGYLKAAEAVPLLLDHVLDEFPPRVAVASRDRLPIAANALADIGEPAIGPTLERTATATGAEWWALQGALDQIDRKSPLVRQAMRTYLEAETGPGAPAAVTDEEKAQRQLLKTRLEKFLATPEPRRPKPKPVANNANSTPQTISAK